MIKIYVDIKKESAEGKSKAAVEIDAGGDVVSVMTELKLGLMKLYSYMNQKDKRALFYTTMTGVLSLIEAMEKNKISEQEAMKNGKFEETEKEKFIEYATNILKMYGKEVVEDMANEIKESIKKDIEELEEDEDEEEVTEIEKIIKEMKNGEIKELDKEELKKVLAAIKKNDPRIKVKMAVLKKEKKVVKEESKDEEDVEEAEKKSVKEGVNNIAKKLGIKVSDAFIDYVLKSKKEWESAVDKRIEEIVEKDKREISIMKKVESAYKQLAKKDPKTGKSVFDEMREPIVKELKKRLV